VRLRFRTRQKPASARHLAVLEPLNQRRPPSRPSFHRGSEETPLSFAIERGTPRAGRPIAVELTFTPPEPAAVDRPRLPLNVGLSIDRSGSIAGECRSLGASPDGATTLTGHFACSRAARA
jgi:hypothetical protein